MIASGARYVLIDNMPWYVVIVPAVLSAFGLLLAASHFFGGRK